MKKIWVLLGVLLAAVFAQAEVSVSNVSAAQTPGTKQVVITYDVASTATNAVTVSLEVRHGDTVLPATSLSGDIGEGVAPGTGKTIAWDAGADWAQDMAELSFTVTVATDEDPPSSIPQGMVLIPGGTNAGTDPDFGEYSLTVESFYMDAAPVTKAQWDEVYNWATHAERGENVYSFDNAGSGKAADHPVHTVNWFDAVKWCNARSEMEERTPVYMLEGNVYRAGHNMPDMDLSANGYRLPTSDEWEYAARGGLVGKRFPWGDTITHSHANYYSDSSFSYDVSTTRGYHTTYETGIEPYTSPVGSFAANGYGLYDMAGNIAEWCWNGNDQWTRIVRGGEWDEHPSMLRCGHVFMITPYFNAYYYGFRTIRW